MRNVYSTDVDVATGGGGGNDFDGGDDVFDAAELLNSPLFNNSTDRLSDSFANENSFGTFEDGDEDGGAAGPPDSNGGNSRVMAQYAPPPSEQNNNNNNNDMMNYNDGGDSPADVRSSEPPASVRRTSDMSISTQQSNRPVASRPVSVDECFGGADSSDDDGNSGNYSNPYQQQHQQMLLGSPKRIASVKQPSPPVTPNDNNAQKQRQGSYLQQMQYRAQQQEQDGSGRYGMQNGQHQQQFRPEPQQQHDGLLGIRSDEAVQQQQQIGGSKDGTMNSFGNAGIVSTQQALPPPPATFQQRQGSNSSGYSSPTQRGSFISQGPQGSSSFVQQQQGMMMGAGSTSEYASPPRHGSFRSSPSRQSNSFRSPGHGNSFSSTDQNNSFLSPIHQGMSTIPVQQQFPNQGGAVQGGAHPLEQMQQFVMQQQGGPTGMMAGNPNASLSQTVHGLPYRGASNPVAVHAMSQSLSLSMHDRRNSYNGGGGPVGAPPFGPGGLQNGSIATDAAPNKGQAPATVGNAMEKLCESMKRSAMSRSLVKQFSGRGSGLIKQNSFRGGLARQSSGRMMVKQMSNRGLMRQTSNRSVVDDASGRGTGPTGAVPIRRASSSTKHHLQPPPRGINRHDSQQSLNGPSNHGINLHIDGRNLGAL